ncbi:MAG: Hsp33 family molecular chaperone HslO [Myxococcota bacterium]
MAEISADGGSWITRALCDEGRVRVIVVEADEVADELRQAHQLTGPSARLAAEGTVATLLLAAYAKGEEKLALQAALQKMGVRFLGELDPTHGYRGRLIGEVPSDADCESLDGLMLVAKYNGDKEVYRGITSIDDASITTALHAHLADSSQVSGALCTEVQLDDDGRVSRAIGLLVERLPPEAGHLHHEPSAFVSRWGDLPDEQAHRLLKHFHEGSLRGERVQVLDIRPVFWGCSCTRVRLLDALAGLGTDALLEMADEDGGAAVNCDYCATKYEIREGELRALAASRRPTSPP